MPINFIPDAGQILMCDFTSGFLRPEMQKVRHCVVVSPRYRRHTGCCLIVPLSTVPPENPEPYHYLVPRNAYPCMTGNVDIWVKGDMITHAAFGRLDRPLEDGRRVRRCLNLNDFRAVKIALLNAIGLIDLIQHL